MGERFYLDLLSPEYNILKNAGNSLGFQHSEDSKAKMSKAGLGRTFSEETRKKISESRKGGKHPLFGKTHSEDTRKKMSDTRTGIKLSEETRKKISDALTGKNRSTETIQKMREAQLGKKHSDSTKNKIREIRLGQVLSESTKNKINQALGSTIFVYSSNFQLLHSFPSSRIAAEHFNCSHMTITRYAKSGKIFQDKYILSLKELPSQE